MIEAKLLVGRYFNFTPTPKRAYQYRAARMEQITCPSLKIDECHGRSGGGRVSNVIGGTNPKKIHRNFKWLPWYEGDFSYTDLTCDVLKGR